MKSYLHIHFWGPVIFFAVIAHADTLSMQQYVQIALYHNPRQKIATATVVGARADYASSRSKLLPNVAGSASFSRSESNSRGTRDGGSNVNSANVGIEGRALVFDFGKTPHVYQASRNAFEAVQYDSQNTTAAVILDARKAYYNYLLSAQLLVVGQDALQQTLIHLNQAQGLFEVGKQAQIAVTKARVDVANAEVDLIKAKNGCNLAKVQMDVAAGVQFSEPLVLTDSLSGLEDSLLLCESIKKAIERSPEMNSSRKNLETQRQLLKAAQAAYFPSVSATAGLGWNANSATSLEGSDFNDNPNWNIGAAVSFPIFEGGAIRASVTKAETSIGKAKAQLDALSQTIIQRVQQYFLQEKEAKQRISAVKTLIEQAEESLKMSQERFRAGIATSIEIMDAEVTLANAKKSQAQAYYDYHIAHANLLLAMGNLKEK